MNENELNKSGDRIKKFNRIIFTLIAFVAAFAIGFFAYVKFVENDEGNKTKGGDPLIIQDATVTSGEYILSIKSNHGSPSKDYDYYVLADSITRAFEEENYTLTYAAGYSLVSGKTAKTNYPDFDSLNQVTINNKSFKYQINQTSMLLIYQPEGMDCYVTINIVQVGALKSDGRITAKVIDITLDDVLSQQVSSILNFEVTKK